jgi:glucose-1-phosphate thymidylyltransferase
MKAIIPVAGAGTKLRPLTYTQPKPLIPVAGKPIIGFILDQLIEAGVQEFVFVLGYLSDKIHSYLEENYPNIKKEYVIQKERLGLGHAIYSCNKLISENEEVLIQLGDTILDLDVRVFMRQKHNTLAVRKVSDPRDFGVVELDDNGMVRKLVEKPQIPKSNLAIVGLYLIRDWSKLMACLEDNIQKQLTTKGEFQLTDGLECMLSGGSRFEVMEVKNWFDCGKKEILLNTNATLLGRQSEERKTHMDYEGSIIIPPVHIGNNCRISHSIIGPNVTIGDNSQVDNTILKDAIIGNFTILEDVVLQRSIIGNDAIVKGRYQSFNIGDNTEIDMV